MKVFFFAGILPCLTSAFVPTALKASTSTARMFNSDLTSSTMKFMESAGSHCNAKKMGRSRTILNQALEDGGVNGTEEKKKVIVLGGDGFCGWPTSLYLSDQGHDIVIVDNLSRRNIDIELGCDSLTPIQSPEVRTTAEMRSEKLKLLPSVVSFEVIL